MLLIPRGLINKFKFNKNIFKVSICIYYKLISTLYTKRLFKNYYKISESEKQLKKIQFQKITKESTNFL